MKCLVPILLLVINYTTAIGPFSFKNNVCSTNTAYFTQFLKSNPKCHYQKEVHIKMPKRVEVMVGKYGETHTVTTKDGYILQNFRLRHPNPKGVILMNPPYPSDSKIWLSHGNASLALIFWQQGYDVWLSNHRGTDYSSKHVTLNTSSSIFWDFSFHEIGLYDLKSTVDYIHNITGMKLVMIGHSMSTTTSYIYASMYPEEAADRVSLIVATAPLAYLHHMKGLAPGLGYPRKIIQKLQDRRGITHFFDDGDLGLVAARIGYHFQPFKLALPWVLAPFMGNTAQMFDPKCLGTVFNLLSGQSMKTMHHYGQFWGRKKCAMFDYGKKKNIDVYGQKSPPDYPLEKIKVPIHLVASTSDYLSTVKDVVLFYERLRPEAKVYGMRVISDINHVDHHFSLHRMEKVWNPVMDLIDVVASAKIVKNM